MRKLTPYLSVDNCRDPEAFDRFASISIPLKGHGNEADFLIFYLMLILSDFAVDYGLINYKETKAKGCHLKNLPVKGL
jgi:hypothetical protein